MPASPACSVRSRCSNCRRGSSLATIRYWMLGRSKPGHEVLGGAEVEPLGDLLVGLGGGGRGQRDPRHLRPALVQHRQGQVVRPEVVPPLGHAVRLVDREQRDLAPLQQPLGAGGLQRLGGQVEQVELPGGELGLHHPALARVLGGVEEAGPHTERPQRVHLVLHERDERRDHHPDAGSVQRRDLVAQRLAAAGGHEHERVAAVHDVLDDLRLAAAEGVVPEDPAQHLQRTVDLGLDLGSDHRAILRAEPDRRVPVVHKLGDEAGDPAGGRRPDPAGRPVRSR